MHPFVLIGLGMAAYGLFSDIIDAATAPRIYPEDIPQPRIRTMTPEEFAQLLEALAKQGEDNAS